MDGEWDFMEEAGPSSSRSFRDKFSKGSTHMEFDDEVDLDFSESEDEADCSLQEVDKGFWKSFCKKASTAFFEQYGLISHQINSFNDFVEHGIQQVFDSIGEVVIEPGYDPSKKGDGEWRRATLKLGKVTLDRPTFFAGEKFLSADGDKAYLDLLPRHAHLQNMTYSSRIKVETHLQISICSDYLTSIHYADKKFDGFRKWRG